MLTDAQIKYVSQTTADRSNIIFRAQINKPPSFSSAEDQQNLVCWWKFDEGYDNKVYDSISNAPEGVVTGCSWWIAKNATGILYARNQPCF